MNIKLHVVFALTIHYQPILMNIKIHVVLAFYE